MTILGISHTHDGTLTVLRDGKNVFSIGEERLNRTKCYIGFPFQALRYVIAQGIVTPEEIDIVAISTGVFKKEWARTYAFELTEDKKYYDIQNDKAPADFYLNDDEWKTIQSDEDCRKYTEKKIRGILDKNKIKAKILFLDHHLCHAASAYYAGGEKEALAITLDGEGDLSSGTVSICRDGKIDTILKMPVSSSIGYLYSEVTRACGFKMSRHEGKITGLAAYGDYKKTEAYFDREVRIKEGSIVFESSTTSCKPNLIYRIRAKLGFIPYSVNFWQGIIRDAGPLSKEDLSAGVQHTLEKKVAELVSFWVKKTGIRKIVTAGGVFANVKLNQRIAELPEVDSFFVYPDMGDGGNAFGAAALAYYASHTFKPEDARVTNVYLGPDFTESEIEKEVKRNSSLSLRKSSNLCQEVAQLIADKKIVGWFQGRMEYGPRALGNRSILAHTADASINKWLNQRMKRTEFMPFAPSCLYESASELFHIHKQSSLFPAEFMTITFDMKDEWSKRAPAISHVDQTARPQLVRKDVNPLYHKLISEYHKITGLPLIINTSFNVHEEPIVCKPAEAIKSLVNGVVDVLVLGDYIVTKK